QRKEAAATKSATPPRSGHLPPSAACARKGASSSVSRGRDGGTRRDLPGSPSDGHREVIHPRQKLGEGRGPKSPRGVVGESPRGRQSVGTERQDGGRGRRRPGGLPTRKRRAARGCRHPPKNSSCIT